MIIKVCGMRDPENIRAVEQASPNMMGFIFWPKSSRHVSKVPSYLPSCQRIGVFVNPTLSYIQECTMKFELNRIQLHGTESVAFCQEVMDAIKLPIIKAISILIPDDIDNATAYEGVADMLLFDTKCKTVGGSGEQFDWDILSGYHGTTPFLLAGGIGPGDEQRLRHWHHPMWAGIDLNSKFELSPALKDVSTLTQFIHNIKDYEPNK